MPKTTIQEHREAYCREYDVHLASTPGQKLAMLEKPQATPVKR